MSTDKRYGDQRDEPLDIKNTRADPDIDEEKMGFQNIEGPGAETRKDKAPKERAPGTDDSPDSAPRP
ncbi:hypothetical protein GAY29_30440 [Azospirillum brasilense]|uniref:hypothetical protein n=1 Tax=Azospirillum brasilense TaxID=192 RepID=UPI00190DE956|nr:hypothetical protein [Azospirillum brasilense]MBK3737295.1 hypothetical protein [Azospirillum brasilense]